MSRKLSAYGHKLKHGTARVKGDALSVAVYRACKISKADRAAVMRPSLQALEPLRKGQCTHDQWAALHAAIEVAQAIESQGIVKGLHAHFESARLALNAIHERAIRPDGWVAGAVYAHELHAVTEAINLHKFQLDQLGRGELIAALDSQKLKRNRETA